MSQDRELTLHPIGRVVKGRPWGAKGDDWEEGLAEIEIEPAWVEALDGVEGFSHVWLVWWLDRFAESPAEPRVHPEGRKEIPPVGIFATRSPHRPNPLAMTAVRLVERQGARLHVKGLDACEDTLILDIKPYLRRGDSVPEATMPEWLEQLWRIHDEEREA